MVSSVYEKVLTNDIIHKIKSSSFLNQIKGRLPGAGIIYPGTIIIHDLCYQGSIHGLQFCFGNKIFRDITSEP